MHREPGGDQSEVPVPTVPGVVAGVSATVVLGALDELVGGGSDPSELDHWKRLNRLRRQPPGLVCLVAVLPVALVRSARFGYRPVSRPPDRDELTIRSGHPCGLPASAGYQRRGRSRRGHLTRTAVTAPRHAARATNPRAATVSPCACSTPATTKDPTAPTPERAGPPPMILKTSASRCTSKWYCCACPRTPGGAARSTW